MPPDLCSAVLSNILKKNGISKEGSTDVKINGVEITGKAKEDYEKVFEALKKLKDSEAE